MLIVLWGCGTAPFTTEQGKGKQQQQQQPKHGSSDAARSDNPGIDLQCAVERIRKAPAPFHWSYKKIAPPLTNVDWEADITPSSIAGAVTDGSGTRVIHGVRSDPTSWDTAVAILTAALPRSTFSFVNNTSAIEPLGGEDVNGERGIKYAIDTSRDSGADASLIRSVLGANGSIKGTAWVTAQGCPIKFILNVEQYGHKGTVHKEHYEANVTQQ